ncbi:MAG: substrate-binding domain-containing protein [Blautia sp.]|nr:substrate-binding domain-containing protein [Blautia sp.]MCM1201335.1 substrate-binding domain-containing protein [Bacteroides fragilis]
MKKRTAIILCLAFCLLWLSAGCGNREEEENTSQPRDEQKIQIGMSFDSFVIERWQRDRDVFVSTAKELGAEVNVQNANGDLEEQKRQIEYLAEKNVDVIVIICVDSDGLRSTVKKARDKGIKVIAYDRLITDTDIDLYISFDNAKVGGLMADSLVGQGIAGGKVLMLGGSPADNNVTLVENQFKRIMQDNKVQILDSFHADGWLAELAAEYVYAHMDLVMEADAIMCGNDDIASRVVPALAEKRLAGRVLVTGQDADLEACQRIVEGTQLMTVYKPVEKLAQRAAECAVALAQGGELTGGSDVIMLDNGSFLVPYIGMEPICVTKDNINEVIVNSGFHLKEDIYLNIPDKMP